MYGLKRVSNRRSDALTRMDWAQVERLLADHYRNAGYAVDHVGTAVSRTRFDGGIDLKLRRDNEFIVVQCKHWNAMKVAHNDVHELLGIMVNTGATGAILVTSGEFTRAAIEAATRHGHVQLVDGDDLREMLGPIPEPEAPSPWEQLVQSELARRAEEASRDVGGRLLDAAEDRIRGGSRRRSGGASAVGTAARLMLIKAAVSLGLLIVTLAVVWILITTAMTKLQQIATARRPAPVQVVQPVPTRQEPIYIAPTEPSAPQPVYRKPTRAEMRARERQIAEQQRKAAEATKIIESTTPELYNGDGPRR